MPLGKEKAKEFLLRGVDFDNLPGEVTDWSWEEWAALLQPRKDT